MEHTQNSTRIHSTIHIFLNSGYWAFLGKHHGAGHSEECRGSFGRLYGREPIWHQSIRPEVEGCCRKLAKPIVPIGIILRLYWGYIGVMEKKMETTIVYLGC